MLSFFRRLINSRAGIVITLAALGVFALAFGLGDITGVRRGGSAAAAAGETVITVGDTPITRTALTEQVRSNLDSARAQQPTLTSAQFVAGAFDGLLDQLVGNTALDVFGRMQQMVVSDQVVDGTIAAIPQLQGADGRFSQALFDQILQQTHRTSQQVRELVRQQLQAQQLITPTLSANQVPVSLALPYASLLLERRQGSVAYIPTLAVGPGATPTDAEVQAYYRRNLARYTVPERRVIRFAVINPQTVTAQSQPSEAEIAQAYRQQQARFQPTEKRNLVQVVVGDQATATALAQRVRSGTALEAAARAAGLEPAVLNAEEKTAYATVATPEAANQVFAAARGALLGPIATPLGFVIVRVDSIQQVPGRTVAQAHDELATALRGQKAVVAMSRIRDAIDDSLEGHATFDELVQAQHLTPAATPALIASGVDPDDPRFHLPPAATQIVAAAFAAEVGDDPQLVPVGADGSFAVVKLDRVVAATPRPLASIRPIVTREFQTERAAGQAHAIARGVVDRVNHGATLQQALATTRLNLPPVEAIGAQRAELVTQQRPSPPLVLLFSMAANSAKLLELAGHRGWAVIRANAIQPGDARARPEVVRGLQIDIGRSIGNEYVQQFVRAVQNHVGVQRNARAIAEVRRQLAGQGASDQP